MFEVKKLFISLLILINSFSIYGAATYKCENIIFPNNEKSCEIHNLNLTRENYHIEPVADNPDAIIQLWLTGTVPVFSATGICEAFHNLKILFAFNLSMAEIAEDSFQKCKNVFILVLQENNLTKVESGAFKGLTKLKRLFLQSNKLFDFDVEETLKFMPSLYQILFGDNNFKCSRLQVILDVLKSKNIDARTDVQNERERSYTPEKIEGIHCLSDAQWEEENGKLSLEQQ